MIIFPITELLDERACYEFLLKQLRPAGLHCPSGHPAAGHATPHDRHREPIIDYRCTTCGKVFNLFTDTEWQKTRYSCSEIVQILRAFAQGTPTLHLARELGRDRGNLLERRHRIQGKLQNARCEDAKFQGVVEADEMYQNAGEKRDTAS